MDTSILTILKDLQENDEEEDYELLDLIKTLEKKKKIKPKITPTAIKISTQSAKCSLNEIIDKEKVANFVAVGMKSGMLDKRIEGIKYGKIVIGSCSKKSGDFYNSITTKIRIREDKAITLRIFNNGSITITGCKRKYDGKKAVRIFIENVLMSKTKIKIKDYKITCINSGFDIGFQINPSNLYKTLIENYKIFVSYNDNYDAVKVVYMSNAHPYAIDGVCQCYKDDEKHKKKKCGGKGTGDKQHSCKRVTISIFHSGKILIIGGISDAQIKEAYDYINKVLIHHYFDIVRTSIKKTIINSTVTSKKILSYFE
jgi:TATA-box binding protein (TBP) (component of TFIID and TFIIIB)